MSKAFILFITLSLSLVIYSCSKKNHPGRTETVAKNDSITVKSSDSATAKKAVFKPKQKDIIPKTIIVNDNAAHKSIDGRLYYDLLGHRYWKNYKDGKYYLFNQAMYANDAFKPR
ncbi:MAG: hypothetical protein ABIO55_06210 [Ginsengibacter sp.]